jgi:hypothetical protein
LKKADVLKHVADMNTLLDSTNIQNLGIMKASIRHQLRSLEALATESPDTHAGTKLPCGCVSTTKTCPFHVLNTL